jgi:hypothetical protein
MVTDVVVPDVAVLDTNDVTPSYDPVSSVETYPFTAPINLVASFSFSL